ncbi:MAG TPA: hypothetical protein VLW65_10220 [Bryobacteraceae bacterium]|nr:hypothetical protein [Bryobacteraceae bacterium]
MLQFLGLARHTSDQRTEPIEAPSSTDSGRDSAPATVTDKAEPSVAITAKLPPVVPRLFVQSNYVTAVRASDGTVLSRGVAAMPADVIELYGTGFGPTNGSRDGGVDSLGAFFTNNPVTVRIGGILSDVRFAGRVGPGLYQINVAVPTALPSGDHPVIASVAEMSTQCEALLKIGTPSDVLPSPEGRYSGFARKAMECDVV